MGGLTHGIPHLGCRYAVSECEDEVVSVCWIHTHRVQTTKRLRGRRERVLGAQNYSGSKIMNLKTQATPILMHLK